MGWCPSLRVGAYISTAAHEEYWTASRRSIAEYSVGSAWPESCSNANDETASQHNDIERDAFSNTTEHGNMRLGSPLTKRSVSAVVSRRRIWRETWFREQSGLVMDQSLRGVGGTRQLAEHVHDDPGKSQGPGRPQARCVELRHLRQCNCLMSTYISPGNCAWNTLYADTTTSFDCRSLAKRSATLSYPTPIAR